MNEKYQQLYQYLQSNGMTDLGADEFYNVYGSDKEKYNQLYGYLVQNQMTDLSSESFYQAYFGGEPKKKDSSPAPAPSSGSFSSLRGAELQSATAIRPFRGTYTPPSGPSYGQVMNNFVKSNLLSGRDLGEISDEAASKYGFTEDDWRSSQIQQAMEAPMEELPQMIDQRQEEIIAARRKALEDKANRAFIPQLVKETFPNAPGLYEGLKFYMESEGTYTSGLLDVFDDAVRGIAGSLSANDAAAEVADIMTTRGNVTLSEAEKFMNAANEHQRFVDKYGVSAEWLDFQQSIQEAETNGENTTLAALYSIGKNPSILSTLVLESFAGLFNKASATAFGSTVAGAAAGGAAVGAAPGAIAAGVASIPFAFGAASTVLETSATFVDLLQQEMANRGMQWTPENIQSALNNEDIYDTVVSGSVKRGFVVGVVDGLSMGIGGAAASALAKKGVSAVGRVAATAPIESAFGSAGEFAGQVAAGQKISGADILIEGLAEAGTAPLTVGQAMLDDYTAKTLPSYTINDKKVNKQQARRIIESSTPEDLKNFTITINNDPELSDILEEKAFRAQVADRIDPAVSSEDRRRIINLELERRALSKAAGTKEKGREADAGQVTAQRIAAIDAEIADINNSYINRVTEEQLGEVPVQETAEAPVEEVALQGVTVQESLNRPATLTSFGGIKFDQPVKGDLYVQDQTLVFETEDKIYEIGNYMEVFENDLSEVGLQVEPERVRTLKDETIEVDGESFEAQLELPTLGIEYDDSGNVARVSLKKVGSDERKMFEGQLAEDVAYQVLLANAESPQQVERVDQLLEQDEQFQREHDEYVASKLAERVSKPVETKTTAEKPASKVPVETPTKPKSSPIKEKPAPAEKANPSMERLSRLLSIETEPIRMATLIAQHDDAVARGAKLTQKQQKELDDAREQLRTSGYSYTAPNIGERYVKNELDEIAYVPDKNLPKGEEVVSSVSRPEIRKNGQVVQPAKLVVRRGIASPMDAKFADKRAKEAEKISKPKNKAQLAKTLEVVFGLPKDKAKADAAVADVMIANMAKRDGISKEEMYGRLSWEKAKSVTPDGKIVPDNTEEVLLFQENIKLSENGFTRTWLKNDEEFAQLKADGLIDDEADIESLFGTSMVLHIPDGMFAGDIARKGTLIMEGEGGVYYPLIPGARESNLFWVSTAKNATNILVNALNKAAKESKDGKVRLALITTNMKKLRTNHTFNTGFVRLLEMMVRDPKSALKKPTLVEALVQASTKSKIQESVDEDTGIKKTKLIQLKADIKKRDSFEVVLEKIYSAIQKRSFQDRLLFSETLTAYLADAAKENKNLREELVSVLFDIGNYESKEDFKPNKSKTKRITAGDIRHALERGFCEPVLRDMFTSQYDKGTVKNGMIYASVEVDVNPNGNTFVAVDTAENGMYTHKSYGWAAQVINPDTKVKVNIYGNRDYWGNMVEHPLEPGSNMSISSDKETMSKTLPASSGLSKAVKTIQRKADDTDTTQILMQGPTVNKKELAQNTKAQVDRIKGLDVAEEDGATFNYDGTEFSEGTGLVVPVGSLNTTQSELTPEMIADYINTMKEVFATDEVKFGLYKFPNSDKVSIDINIMVPEDNEALAMKFARFAGQFSVFKMSDFSTIQTGASGKNPKTFSKQQYAEIAQRLKDNNIDPFIENNNAYSLPEEVDAVMTQDEEGNYVFRHYSDERRDQVKPMAGEKTHTSRDEAAAIGQVGGVAMYYVDSTKEVSPNVPHIVKVPKNRVYYFNEDKLNLFDQALESYRKFMDNPNAKFPSFNHQLAWVTKAANENGFDMVVSEWNRGPAGLRAQTTRPMTPVEGDFKMSGNTRQLPNLVPGDNINVRGQIGVFVGFNGEGDNRTIEYVTKTWDNRPDTIKEPMWRLKDPNYDKYFVSRLRAPIYKLGEDGSIYNIDNKEQVYFQNQRAAIAIKNKEGVVYAISSPDVTSPLHELAHLYEQYLTEEERATVLEWAGHEEWGRDTSEAFAEGFEKFLYDGSVSNLSLVNIFKSFKNWLGEIYSSIKGTPLEIELSDKMRQLYDTMLSMHEPENSIHSQQAVDGVYYQGPMNDQGQSEYEPSKLSNFRAMLLYLRRVLQDKYAEVLWLTEDVKAQGRKVGLESDFRMMEELMPGKTMADFRKFEAKLDAAKEFMRKNKMMSDDLSDYLYALHAPSRNQRIFEKYGKENGSGMSNEEANALIEELEQKYPKEVLEQGAQMFKDMLAENRQVMIEFGLEPQDVINSWEQDDTYVPLYGVAIDEMDVESSKYPTGGSGIHVYGRTSKKAKGRKSKATNVLANIIVASTALRIKARKNEALVSLLNLVQQNPSSAWSVETSVEFGADSTVGVRVDGQQLFIRFKNRALAEQLKNMGVDNVNVLNKILSLLPTAWLRKSLTTMNPEFFIPNFTRDLEAALFNAAYESEEGGIAAGFDIEKEVAKIKKKVWPVMKSLVARANGRPGNPVINQYMDEMIEDGGLTGYTYAKPISEIARELDRDLSPNKLYLTKNVLGKIGGYVEGVNDAFEQTIRLSVYIAGREKGMSRPKAAQLAKNITVNFNKYGEWGITLNQLKLFFGASIQGSYRFFTTMGSRKNVTLPDGTTVKRLRKSQKLGLGLFGLSSALTAINIAMSGEDEDGELFYNKIPDHEKQRNLILMYDKDKYFKLPMAYGFGVLSTFGEAVTSAALGERDADDAFIFSMSSILNSFSPVQFGSYSTPEKALITAITPSGLAAFGEAAINETFFGTAVYREQMPFGTPVPEYQLAYKSPKFLKDMAQWMNESTGGSEYTPGLLDFNPDRLYHYWNFYIGGAGRFVDRTGTLIYNSAEMIKEGERVKMTTSDLPLVRQIYGELGTYYDYDKFRDNLVTTKQLLEEYEDPKARREKSRYGRIYLLSNEAKKAEKMLKANREKIRKAEQMENYVDRQNRIFELYEEQRLIMMRFNKLYNEKGPKED